MDKLTIRDIDLKGKRVLIRVDFNVPIKDGKVGDDTRITSALPTIKYVLDHGASVILMSHLGRPKGKPSPEFSLKPVAEYLSNLMHRPVLFAPDCVGPEVKAMAESLRREQHILLLENLRFHAEEEGKAKVAEDATDDVKKAAKAEMKKKQEEFARQLSELGEIYVNDAFGTAHRAHASTAIITKFFQQNVAGFLMEKELKYMGAALANPERPFIAILGGAKVSDKVNVIANLLTKVDALLIGGAMAYTFYRAMGIPVGKSLVEEDKKDLAADLIKQAEARGVKLMLPVDNIVADAFSASANTKVVARDGIPSDWESLDIGPETAKLFAEEVKRARTVIWNGPMGCFEMAPFAGGTLAIAKAIAETACVSIIGGGDSVSAINQSGLAAKMTHISTGGGASLEFLEGKVLPGVDALTKKA